MKQKFQKLKKLMKENKRKTLIVLFALFCLCSSAFYGIYNTKAKNLIAREISYSPLNSGLTATNVQDAIEQLYLFGTTHQIVSPDTTYVAQFECNGCIDDSNLVSQSISVGGKVARPTDPQKTNFGFSGWYSDAQLTQAYDFNTVVTSDIILYAKWDLNFYTITFDSQGGSAISPNPVNVSHGFKLTRPTDPTKSGYDFGGWYKESSCTNAYDFNDGVINSFTLYAKWTGSELDFSDRTITKAYSPNAQTFNVYAATGGSGNYTYEKTSGSENITVSSAGVVTIPAGTTADTYSITIKATDTNTGSNKSANYTIVINKLVAEITCSNKTYNKSQQNIASCSGGTVGNNLQTNAGDYAITCAGDANHDNAQEKTCSISKANNQITITKTVKVEDGSTTEAEVTALDGTPTVNYYSDSSCNTIHTGLPTTQGNYYVIASVGATNNYNAITSNCTWGVEITQNLNHTVTYDYATNGGSTVSKTSEVVTSPNNIDLSVTASKTGYDFIGWNTDSNSHSKLDSLQMGGSDVTLYAIFKKKTPVTLTFDSNGATTSGTKSKDCYFYNNETSCNISMTSPTISRTGYNIIGYNTNKNGTTSEWNSATAGTKTINSNTTYYAITNKTITINFVANGNTVSETSKSCNLYNEVTSCTIKTPIITAPANTPNVVGFTKTSSYSSANVVSPNTDISVTENGYLSATTFYAQTKSNTIGYTATFTKGENISSIGATTGTCTTSETYNGQVPYSTCKVTMPTITGNESSASVSWYNGTNSHKPGDLVDIGTNTTFEARSTAKTYTIRFESNGGTTIPNQTVTHGDVAARPNNPIKNGYTFDDWYTNSGLTNKYTFGTKVTSNITLYAKYTQNGSSTDDTNYTVTFITDGGTNLPNQTVKHGNKVTRPADPNKNGYTFENWYTDNTYKVVYDFNSPVTRNLTIYAKFNDNGGGSQTKTFTVVFNTDGGTNIESQTVIYGARVNKPANPSKAGYTFDDWYTSDTFKTKYDFTSTVKSNLVIYARFVKGSSGGGGNSGGSGGSGGSSGGGSNTNPSGQINGNTNGGSGGGSNGSSNNGSSSNNSSSSTNGSSNDGSSSTSNVTKNSDGTYTIKPSNGTPGSIVVNKDDVEKSNVSNFTQKEVTGQDKESISQLFPGNTGIYVFDVIIYDKNGNEVDMTGKTITYKLPIPDFIDITDNFKLFRVNGNYTEEILYTIEDGYISFTTIGAGRFAIVVMPKKEMSDLNGSGIIIKINDDLYDQTESFTADIFTDGEKKVLEKDLFKKSKDSYIFKAHLFDNNNDEITAPGYYIVYSVPIPDGMSENDNIYVYCINNGKKIRVDYEFVDERIEFGYYGTGTFAIVKYPDDYIETDTAEKKKSLWPWLLSGGGLASIGGAIFAVASKKKNEV